MTRDDLNALINENISSDDVHTTIVLGHFLTWYGYAEMGITSMLYAISKATDLERFSILCRGMDGKAKVERFKQLADLDRGIGPNLLARLEYFHMRIAGLRNRIAHGAVREKSKAPGQYQIISIGVYAQAPECGDLEKRGADFTAGEILGLADWLRSFSRDTSSVMASIRAGKIPEIDDPLTSLPAVVLRGPQQPKKPTKAGKPA